jgi:tetratricopeptide (TPR) repeat protein
MGIPGTGIYRIDYAGKGPTQRAAARSKVGGSIAGTLTLLGPKPYTPWKNPPKGIELPVIFLSIALLTALLGGQDAIGGAVILTIPCIYLIAVRKAGRAMRETWQNLQQGKQLLQQGQYAGAVDVLERAVRSFYVDNIVPAPDSGVEEAIYYAGVAYAGIGNYEKSLNYLERVNPTATFGSRLGYAHALIAVHRPDDAIKVLQELSGDEAENPLSITLLGKAFAEKGDHQTAIEVYKRGHLRQQQMDDAMINLRYAYARSLEAVGQTKQAIGEFKKVLAYDAAFEDASDRVQALESKERIQRPHVPPSEGGA